MLRQRQSPALTTKIRLWLLAASILGCVLLFVLLYPIIGAAASAVSILPVMVSGWCFGLRVGLVAGLGFLVLNVLTISLISSQPVLEGLLYGAPGYFGMVLAGIVVGRLHDLEEQGRQELDRRSTVEHALRDSEIRFRTLVEQSPFSTQIFRPDGSVIAINQAFCSLWNASAVEAQYLIDHYNILQDEQLKTSGLMQFIQQGFTDSFTEIPAIEYDPQRTEMVKQTHLATKWVLGYIWPVKDEQGQVQQVVLMHQDITERKQVETQELELALSRERADLLRELLNTLSHDLKTPLSIINTSLDLLQKTSDPAYQQSKLDNIKQQAHRLNQMIQNILTTSFLETASDTTTQRLDLNTISTQIREEFSSIAENRSISLELMLDSTLPPVLGSEVEMRRVLVNLVENALRYTPSSGSITLQTSRKADQVVVEVRDTGIGIDEADLAYIFDPFYRADKARAADQGGTGLGLAIARKIVERYQGKIEVKSTPGQGSNFTVSFPILHETIVSERA
jgi:signal transduction histidine kinase